jgi:hypothetical protein
MHVLLGLRITGYLDVALPQFSSQQALAWCQQAPRLRRAKCRSALAPVERVGVVGRGMPEPATA